jgi:hypothetical protein
MTFKQCRLLKKYLKSENIESEYRIMNESMNIYELLIDKIKFDDYCLEYMLDSDSYCGDYDHTKTYYCLDYFSNFYKNFRITPEIIKIFDKYLIILKNINEIIKNNI